MDAPTRWQDIARIAAGALFYSLLIIFTRSIQGMETLTITFFRAVFALLFFCILLIWFRSPLKFSQYRPHLWKMLLMGCFMTATASLYIFSIRNTSAANAALLINTSPVYIAFLAPVLLKEARPRYTWISLALLIPGAALITGVMDGGFDTAHLLGNLAGALGGFLFAVVLIFSRSLVGKVDGLTQTAWGALTASLLLLPFGLSTTWGTFTANLPLLAPMGAITLGLAPLMYFLALQKLKAQVVSVVAILEPVFGVLIGVLIFQEALTIPAMLGSVLILASIYLISK
jgi:drug/metabolite transporter (DMT)-like permease